MQKRETLFKSKQEIYYTDPDNHIVTTSYFYYSKTERDSFFNEKLDWFRNTCTGVIREINPYHFKVYSDITNGMIIDCWCFDRPQYNEFVFTIKSYPA